MRGTGGSPTLVRMKLLTAYSIRAERVAFTLGTVLAVLVVVRGWVNRCVNVSGGILPLLV